MKLGKLWKIGKKAAKIAKVVLPYGTAAAAIVKEVKRAKKKP